MKEKKPDVRRFKACMVEVCKSPYPISDTWEGIYKWRLDFVQWFNGKRRRVLRMDASVAELKYMRERIDLALEEMKAEMLKAFD